MTSRYFQVAETQLQTVKEEYETAKAEITKFEGEKEALTAKVRDSVLCCVGITCPALLFHVQFHSRSLCHACPVPGAPCNPRALSLVMSHKVEFSGGRA